MIRSSNAPPVLGRGVFPVSAAVRLTNRASLWYASKKEETGMTIHHDKMAYGRLTPLRDDFSEERLAEMAKKLSESAAEEETAEIEQPAPEKQGAGSGGKAEN